MLSQERYDSLMAHFYFTVGYILTAICCDYISPRILKNFSKVKRILFINFSVLFLVALAVPSMPIPRWKFNVLNQWIISFIILELWFYYVHRLMHWGPLYRRFHKQHHEFIKPYGSTGIYCSVTELIAVNQISVSLGPIVTGMTGWSLALWFLTIAFFTVVSHSGLTIPYLSDGSHDIHHLRWKYNYGIFEVLDWVHGTQYKESSK